MAAVTPAGNAYYVNQAAPLASQHVANAQSASIFQAALAQQLFANQEAKVESVSQPEQEHEINEKEKEKKEFSEEKREKKEHEEPQEENEASSNEHLLDLKA